MAMSRSQARGTVLPRLSSLGVDRRAIRHVLDQGVADRRYVSATGVRQCCGMHQQSMAMPSRPAMAGSGPSAIYCLRTSAGSFDGWSSTPAIGSLAAKSFCRFRRLGQPDRALRHFPVKLTMQQVKDSPDVDTDQPVSRQIEAHVYDYYGWDPYWGGSFFPMATRWRHRSSRRLLSEPKPRDPGRADAQPNEGDPHLRSIATVTGYHIHATDGEIGHVEDFLVDDAGWNIRYIKVDTRNWWPGERVLISPHSVREIDWASRLMHLNVNRQKVKDSPPYDPSITVDGAYEEKFLTYYGILAQMVSMPAAIAVAERAPHSISLKEIRMSEEKTKLSGPDLTQGVELSTIPDGTMLLGHAQGEPVLLARRGDEVFAIGAICTHYGAPLEQGLLVGDTVRCPWHHACFSLRTGEALRAPALDPVSRWRVEEVRDVARQFTPVEQRVGAVYVREKLEQRCSALVIAASSRRAGIPIVIVGGGAAGNAAAETLRHEGYSGRITMLSADESVPCDRPNLSKGYLAGTASDESNLLRSAKFYKDHEIDLHLGARVAAIDIGERACRAGGWQPARLWRAPPRHRRRPGAARGPRRRSSARALSAHARGQPRSCLQGSGITARRGDRRQLHRSRGGSLAPCPEYRRACGRARDNPDGENPGTRGREFHPQAP